MTPIKKIQEYRKEYYETNKEKIQEYYETNKEYIKEQTKQHYENNKEQIKEKMKEKITCKCGSVVLKRDLKRHEGTKKHINLMNPIQ
jgi:guanylate kinase